MMELFDKLCQSFQPLDEYSECSNSVCEKIPTDATLKSRVQRACEEFRTEFEDDLTATSRDVEDDGKIAALSCKRVSACLGTEKIKFGDVLKLKEEPAVHDKKSL